LQNGLTFTPLKVGNASYAHFAVLSHLTRHPRFYD
jgi:hypothetical protein